MPDRLPTPSHWQTDLLPMLRAARANFVCAAVDPPARENMTYWLAGQPRSLEAGLYVVDRSQRVLAHLCPRPAEVKATVGRLVDGTHAVFSAQPMEGESLWARVRVVELATGEVLAKATAEAPDAATLGGQLAQQLAEGDRVFVSSVLAEQLDIEQGDTIWVQTRRGRRPFTVNAIVVDFYNQGMVIHASWKDLRRYFGNNDVSAFLIQIDTDANAQVVRDRIDALYGEARHLTVQSNASLRDRALGLISQTSVMFDALAAIAMAVAALGVVNTMTMNVYERTQEIGMLRSIGMARRQVRKMVLAEAFLVGEGNSLSTPNGDGLQVL